MAVLQEHIIFSVKWVEFINCVRFFEQNCIVKWVIFFASFCWLWDFLLENLKLKNKLWWYPLARVEKYKNFVCPKKYFQKKNSKHEIFKSFIFWSDIRFFGGLLWSVVRRRPTMVVDIFAQLPHDKNASYNLVSMSTLIIGTLPYIIVGEIQRLRGV